MNQRVCLIPLRTDPRNPLRNIAEFERRLLEAARLNPSLICLPECSFTGYLYELEDFQRFAEPVPGETTRKVAHLAREYGCAICFGLLEATSLGVFNSAVLVDRSGEILLVHRKNVEHPPFVTGDSVPVIQTEFGKLAILICGDLFDDEVKRKIPRPVDLVLMPMARSFDRVSPDQHRWENEERQVYVSEVGKLGATTLIVNALDSITEEASFGGAMIVSAEGNLLVESPHGSDGLLVIEEFLLTK